MGDLHLVGCKANMSAAGRDQLRRILDRRICRARVRVRPFEDRVRLVDEGVELVRSPAVPLYDGNQRLRRATPSLRFRRRSELERRRKGKTQQARSERRNPLIGFELPEERRRVGDAARNLVVPCGDSLLSEAPTWPSGEFGLQSLE